MGKKNKNQTVGFRYFVGVHFILCHGPIDRVKAVWVDDKLLWRSIGPDRSAPGAGRVDGYENISVNEPGLFGGEDREGGVVGDFDIGMGHTTQPANGYLGSVLQGRLIPGYRGAVSVILKQIYAGASAYLKPWKFRAQRVWAPDAERRPQWSASYAGIGPKYPSIETTYSHGVVVIGDVLYRLPNAVLTANGTPEDDDPIMASRFSGRVQEINTVTGEMVSHRYGLTNPVPDIYTRGISLAPSAKRQDDAPLVFNGPNGIEIFCGVYGGPTAPMILILNPGTRTSRWVQLPPEVFVTAGGNPSPQRLMSTTLCWVAATKAGVVFIRSFAAWPNTYNNLWRQDSVRYRLTSYNLLTGEIRDEPWGASHNVSIPISGTGAIATAMHPDRGSMYEHSQFMFAVNGSVTHYNSLFKYNLEERKLEPLGDATKVQNWMFNPVNSPGGLVIPAELLVEVGTAVSNDGNVYTIMGKHSGQQQNGMLAVWKETSTPSGLDTWHELHWPTSEDYVGQPEFWYAPVPSGNYMKYRGARWYASGISLDDGRVVFPPANPHCSGVMLIPSKDSNGMKGAYDTNFAGADLSTRPWPTSAGGYYADEAWALDGVSEHGEAYMVGAKIGENDYVLVSGKHAAYRVDPPYPNSSPGWWQGDPMDEYSWDGLGKTRIVLSYSDGLYARLMTDISQGPWDMNPAHIIRECMTNRSWGRGLPDSIIGPTYQKVATTLYREKLGLSMLWTSEMAVNDFIMEVIRHIDAVRYEDPETGLQEIKLIRPDYDVATLPVLSPSNCHLEQLTEPLLYDLVNQITVNFWNRDTGEDSALAVQDTASINMTGTVNNQTMEYSGICSSEVALMVAQRDLARYSKPFRQGRLIVNRKVANLKPGDPFVLTWPARGVDRLVCRAALRSDNGELDGQIGIEFGEDIFSLAYNVAAVPPPSGWEDPIGPPLNFDYVTMFDVPYVMLVDLAGETVAAATPDDTSYACFAGTRPLTGMHLQYGCFIYPAGTTPPTDSQREIRESFTPLGITDEDIPELTADVIDLPLQVANDMGNARAGDWVLVGNADDRSREVLCLAEDPGNRPVSIKVTRAAADTYPRAIPKGTPLYLVGTFYAYDETERVSGEEIAGYGAPNNGRGSYPGPFTFLQIDMVGRQGLPYPAAGFQVDGSYQDNLVTDKAQVTMTWRHRNRIQQANQALSWLTGSDVPLEAGVSYQVRQVALDDAMGVISELPVLPAGQVSTLDLDLADQPYPVGARFSRLTVEAVKDGRVSLQNRPITVKLAPKLYAPYDLRPGAVADVTVSAPYNLRPGVAEVRPTAPYDLRPGVVADLLGPYNLRPGVVADLLGPYNLRPGIAADVTVSAPYDLRPGVVADVLGPYNLRPGIVADVLGPYNLRPGVVADVLGPYDLRPGVVADVLGPYDLRPGVVADVLGPYDLRPGVVADLLSPFNLRPGVVADVLGPYDLRPGFRRGRRA